MGYELNRLMSQYGATTPSAAFTGVAPVAPVAPVYDPAATATPAASGPFSGRLFNFGTSAATVPSEEEKVSVYNALIAKYNEDMPVYLAEKARAEQLAAQRELALKANSMYDQAQFGYQGDGPVVPEVAPVAVQPFTPLAPLAYMGKTLGTNAAGERSSFDTSGGMGGEGVSTDNNGPGPTGVSTTGGFGTMGALGIMGQAALGSIANALSTPNTQAQQDAISVVDMGPTSLGASAMGGTTGPGAASGIGVGSTSGINGMDAASDAASAAAAASSSSGHGGTTGTDTGDDGSSSGDSSGDGTGSGGDGPGSDGGSSGGDGGGSAGGDGGGDGGWAKGGRVTKDRLRRRFAEGGLNDLAGKYDLASEDLPMPAVTAEPMGLMGAETAPVSPAPAAAPVGMGLPPGLEQMLSKYQSGQSAYGEELKAARALATKESEAFANMLKGAMDQTGQAAPSKAEMYFRLAAAFGAPTKTGNFMENVAAAGKTLGEYAKETREADRASKASRMQLALEGQKLKMAGAKEDLSTLRTLAGEEMKDKRAVATKLLEQYIKSGEPESTAGKQAKDEGLRPGSPEFQARVAKIAENNVNQQLDKINATLANVSVAQANQALAQQKFDFQQGQAAKLTPAEVKMKAEAEDALTGLDSSITALQKAYKLNPNTFDASLVDTAQRKALEAAGSKDPKVQNTREMENLLSSGAVEKLKASFGGNPTEGERDILLSLEGLGAKSKEERAKIMKNTYIKLKAVRAARQKRLNEISSGLYRNTGEADTGGLE